jgi:hypothetical protein
MLKGRGNPFLFMSCALIQEKDKGFKPLKGLGSSGSIAFD